MGKVVAEIKNGDMYIAGDLTTGNLTGKVFDIDQSGNLSVFDIDERPIGIPSDAYYYPLDFDAMDETKTYGPSEITSGVVFEDGGVRVPHGESLEFNLNSSIGMNWAGDWSIVYYKTPQSTATGNLLGYDLESLGCNSNSVGGGYVFWGKNNNSDSIYNSSPASIDPAKYFGFRQCISLIKSGTTLTFRHRFIDGIEYIRTTGVSTAAANYYVTQYGYDLKLGGWDNKNSSNAKYRDLIVVKRAITDEELKQLSQVYYDCNGTTLKIQGNFIEGATL